MSEPGEAEETRFSGACACGAVTVEITGAPAGPYQCYCRQCQHVSGGGPATFVMAPRGAVRIAGEVASWTEPTESGNAASRSFCPRCGTPVCSQPGANPESIVIKLSMFSPGTWDSVRSAFWTAEAPAWAKIDSDIKMFSTQP